MTEVPNHGAADDVHGHGETGPSGHGHDEHGHTEHDHEHEPEQLRVALQERLIEMKNLSGELKLLVGLAVLVLAFLAVFAITRSNPLGSLVSQDYFSETGKEAAYMPKVLFVACVGFFSFAWALIVTAASRAGWTVRIATLVALGLAFGPNRLIVTGIDLATTVTVSVMLGVVAVIVVASWFPEREVPHHKDPKQINAGGTWRVLRRLVLPVTFAIFVAMYVYIWHQGLATQMGGISQGIPADEQNLGWFSYGIGLQLDNMQWLLIPMLVLAGADFGDWSYFAYNRVFRRIKLLSNETVTVLIGLAASGGILYNGLRVAHSDSGAGIQPELVLAGIVAAITVILVFAMKPRDGWTSHYPFAMVAAAVAFDGLNYFIIQKSVTNDPNGFKADGYDALTWLALAAIGMIVVLALRKRGPRWLTFGAAFAVLVGSVYTLTSLYSVTSIVHVNGWNPDISPFIGYEGFEAGAAVIAIVAILVALATGRIRKWAEPLVMLVGVAVAIQILDWINSLYGSAIKNSGNAAAHGATLAATVMVVALSWEFATSGESITNGHARRFPRDSRLMSFLGYVLLTATVSVFWSTIGDIHPQLLAWVSGGNNFKVIESQFEAESFVQQGLLFVGVPLVIFIFVLRFNTWRQKQAQEAGGHGGHGGGAHDSEPAHAPGAPAPEAVAPAH